MRSIYQAGIGTLAVVSIALVGCQKKDAVLTDGFNADRYFSQLKKEKFVDRKGQALDVEAVVAAMPDTVAIKYTSSEFNTKSGATVLSDVTLTQSDNLDVGLRIGEISIWGADNAAILDRMSGKTADQDLIVASRIEAANMELFGLETLMSPLMDISNDMVEGMAGNDPDMADVDLTSTIESYEFLTGTFILTDFVLHPSVLRLTDLPAGDASDLPDEDSKVIWHWFQKVANYTSMFSFNDVVWYDNVYDLTLTQYGQPNQMSGIIEYAGYKGIRRGDIDYGITRNMSYDMDIPMPALDGKPAVSGQTLTMTNVSQQTVMRDVRLAKAMDHVARGVMPERSDTDFMSLGVLIMEGSRLDFNGARTYSIDRMVFDMSDFHWLVPEIIDIRIENMRYNIEGFMDYMQASMGAIPAGGGPSSEEFEQMSEVIEQVIPILEKYDLEEPSIDVNVGVKWNGDNGETALDYGVGVDDFIRYSMKGEFTLPDYASAIAIVPENIGDLDEDAFQALIKDKTTFKRYEARWTDEGGFEKGFAMAKELAALAPEDSREVAFLRSNSPEQLREMMAGSLLLAAGPVHKAFPPATEYLQAVSNFIREGGELVLSAKPGQPIDSATIETIPMLVASNPDEVVETLGLSVVHTPPK